MKAEDLYHTGIVVDDIEAAQRWYSELAGYSWTPVSSGTYDVELPGGSQTLTFSASYTLEEPRLELVGSLPGTTWQPVDSGLHHLGYWSDDVQADVDHLVAKGFEIEALARGPKGKPLWAYCRKAPVGPRLEFVSVDIKPMLFAKFNAR